MSEKTATKIQNFLRDERGTTAIEYAFIAGLVSVAAISAFQSMAASVMFMYTSVSSAFVAALAS